MRIWVNEQSKLQSSQWDIDVIFRLFKYDVRISLDILFKTDKQEIAMENTDTSTTVCVSLRAKLMIEIEANIYKLNNTVDQCLNVLSSVCRTLSHAYFSLCFPSSKRWEQSYINHSKDAYVSFVLDQIFLPALKATDDIDILKLILKLICESWIDFIYSQKIKFTPFGALALINDFEEVKDWISKISYVTPEHIQKLVNHEVLRMCNGVGKVLVRKPRQMIPLLHSPGDQKLSSETQCLSGETQLPSEMFVSNQSNWLQLRAPPGNVRLMNCCTPK